MQDTDPAPSASQAARLAAWIRLEQTPGLGRLGAQRLLTHFHTPQAIFEAGHPALAALLPARLAARLCAPCDSAIADTTARALAWLAEDGNHLITLDDARYPPLLRQIGDAPVLLYAKGRVALLAGPALAIVGSRNASAQGVANAVAFGHALASTGLTIVSGMALGIDAAAHEGALRATGATVAVVGTGVDRIYPARNRDLAHRIAAHGCIISEYALGTSPKAANFPLRNRLISGLCCAVLVVEAAAESGSLITAHLANDQGRDVFAIPGSIHSPLSKGCHKLIKEGAKLVESASDLLLELRLAPLAIKGYTAPPYSGEHGALLEALGQEPMGPDLLAALTALDAGALCSQLLALELAGHVERLPGGLFQRVNR